MNYSTTALADLGIRELLDGYREQRFSPLEVLAAVESRAPAGANLGALSWWDGDGAAAQARESEQRWREGRARPLEGVPVTVKDSLDVRGWRSTAASRLRVDSAPATSDEPAVARLREAGCVLVGKTTMPEFAWCAVSDSPLYGLVRNAWDDSRTAGGSSGGAAVAVALGIGAIALGSDGGGSIRIPASFNGVVGLKATYGRIPALPSGAFGRLAHIGPLTRTVEDSAITLDVIAQPDPRDPYAGATPSFSFRDRLERAALPPLRVAFSPNLGGARPNPDVVAALEKAAAALAERGLEVIDSDVGWPDLSDRFELAWLAVLAAQLGHLKPAALELMDPALVQAIERGKQISATTYLRTFSKLDQRVHSQMTNLAQNADLLVTPTVPLTAFAAGNYAPNGSTSWISWTPYTWPFNLTGQPAISVPIGRGNDGLPIGLQVVARRGRDDQALAVATLIEQDSGFLAENRIPYLVPS
ncbi:MAG: amidase [Bifidobacteriaceae bacterium]|nr:amidase [Bifidobacteriaceae bacterium]